MGCGWDESRQCLRYPQGWSSIPFIVSPCCLESRLLSCSFCRGQDGSLPAPSCVPALCPPSDSVPSSSCISLYPLSSLCSSRIFSILLEKPEGSGPWLKLSGGLAQSLLSNIKFLFAEPQPYTRFGDTEVQSSACCHRASIPVRKTGSQQIIIQMPLKSQ